MKVLEHWNEKTGESIVEIREGNINFVGTALCHPDDEDMKSHLTGNYIASIRAEIERMKHYRDNELKPRLRALEQLYYSMNRSKKFNEKSYENRMLQRQIRFIKNELSAVSQDLQELRKNVKTYIDVKEDFYKAVRRKRQGKIDQENSQNL